MTEPAAASIKPPATEPTIEAITEPRALLVTMHSKSDCPYSDEARAFLTGHAIPFTEIRHDDDACESSRDG